MYVHVFNLSNLYWIGGSITQENLAMKLITTHPIPILALLLGDCPLSSTEFYNLFLAFSWLDKIHLNQIQQRFQFSPILILLFRSLLYLI